VPPATSNRTHRQPNPLDPGILLGAMRDQLGPMVKSQKGPVDFLVIDGVEKWWLGIDGYTVTTILPICSFDSM